MNIISSCFLVLPALQGSSLPAFNVFTVVVFICFKRNIKLIIAKTHCVSQQPSTADLDQGRVRLYVPLCLHGVYSEEVIMIPCQLYPVNRQEYSNTLFCWQCLHRHADPMLPG